MEVKGVTTVEKIEAMRSTSYAKVKGKGCPNEKDTTKKD